MSETSGWACGWTDFKRFSPVFVKPQQHCAVNMVLLMASWGPLKPVFLFSPETNTPRVDPQFWSRRAFKLASSFLEVPFLQMPQQRIFSPRTTWIKKRVLRVVNWEPRTPVSATGRMEFNKAEQGVLLSTGSEGARSRETGLCPCLRSLSHFPRTRSSFANHRWQDVPPAPRWEKEGKRTSTIRVTVTFTIIHWLRILVKP